MPNLLMMDSPTKLSFISCAFCPNEKLDLYKCPQCSAHYCSLRCFRCKKHLKCSEKFYQRQCEKHVESVLTDSELNSSSTGKDREANIATFEQYMAQQNQDDKKADKNAINPQIAVRANEQILFDSDDEPEYLSKMVASTLEQFNSLDEDELNRRILNAGLPIALEKEHTTSNVETNQEQMEQLYQQLTSEERRKFTELADEIFRDDLQNEMNCFVKKK